MKRLFFLFASLLIYLMLHSSVALSERVFEEAFFEATFPESDGLVSSLSVAVSQEKIYCLMGNGAIYCWNPQTKDYRLYAHVPAVPSFNIETSFSAQSNDIKEQLSEAVFTLIGAHGHLYGFNPITGTLGRIDEQGIHWNHVQMDTSMLIRKDSSYPPTILYPIVDGEELYGFYDMAWEDPNELPLRSVLISFDLNTGECKSVDIKKTYALCPYGIDKLLLLRCDDTDTLILSIYDRVTGELQNIDLSIPLDLELDDYGDWWSVSAQIGGLAYDVNSNAIYLADAIGVWVSRDGGEFTRAKAVDDGWTHLYPGACAWILSDGSYVLYNGDVFMEQLSNR